MNHQQTAVSTKTLCLTAVLAAFVFIMTFVPKIPIPLGYAHLGDAAKPVWQQRLVRPLPI